MNKIRTMIVAVSLCATAFVRAQNADTPATNALPPSPICPVIATSKLSLSDYEQPQHQMRWVMTPMARRRDPTNSTDSHFDWWPHRNTNEWIQAEFKQPETISETQVYWFNDSKKRGGCGLPVSWRAFYKDGDQWKAVETTNEYTVSESQYDKVTFKSVTTSGFRLEVQLQTNWSGGVEAWKVK